MRRWAIVPVVLLAACGRKPAPTPPAASPAPQTEGVALIEIFEENFDSLDSPLSVQDMLSSDGVVDAGEVLRLDSRLVREEERGDLRVLRLEGKLEEVALAVLMRQEYSGKGRAGGRRRFFLGGGTLALKAPALPGDKVGGGIRSSLGTVLSRIHLWPGDLALRREGADVVLVLSGKETRLAPGQEIALPEISHKASVIEEFPDDGSGVGVESRPGIRRLDLGVREFRSRLTIRHLGLRTREVTP
ncbi:MAG: hypothetical protein HYY18_11110 [Planctomycetes bacterium]|nr:hypothetical protein [Planctomycetota bacterium]